MTLIIKNSPKTKVIIDSIFNSSLATNGIGIVSAKYREIKELLTKKEF